MSSVEPNLFSLFFSDKFVLLYNARRGLDKNARPCTKIEQYKNCTGGLVD